jgi:hypothetical protein
LLLRRITPHWAEANFEITHGIADLVHWTRGAANYFSNFARACRIDRLRVAFARRRELDRVAKCGEPVKRKLSLVSVDDVLMVVASARSQRQNEKWFE